MLLFCCRENYTSYVNGSVSAILFFGASRCAPCHSFSRLFRRACQLYSEDFPSNASSVLFAYIDGDACEALKEQHAVTAYPWVCAVPAGFTNSTQRYSSTRDAGALAAWMASAAAATPVMKHTLDVDAEQFLEMLDGSHHIVAVFSQSWFNNFLNFFYIPPLNSFLFLFVCCILFRCHPCKVFHNIYDQVADELLHLPVQNTLFLSVDVGTNDYLKAREQLTEYPTVKFFSKDNPQEGILYASFLFS